MGESVAPVEMELPAGACVARQTRTHSHTSHVKTCCRPSHLPSHFFIPNIRNRLHNHKIACPLQPKNAAVFTSPLSSFGPLQNRARRRRHQSQSDQVCCRRRCALLPNTSRATAAPRSYPPADSLFSGTPCDARSIFWNSSPLRRCPPYFPFSQVKSAARQRPQSKCRHVLVHPEVATSGVFFRKGRGVGEWGGGGTRASRTTHGGRCTK